MNRLARQRFFQPGTFAWLAIPPLLLQCLALNWSAALTWPTYGLVICALLKLWRGNKPFDRRLAALLQLLSAGLLATLLEIPNWWDWIYDGGLIVLYAIWAVMLLLWIAWAIVFFIYWRQGDRYTQLGKMIRGLFVGSLLELLVAAPVQAFTHERDCYCARGSYTGLVFGVTVLLWCFGPGVILLFVREKVRRERLAPRCAGCGCDLRGTLADDRTQCPECGMDVPEEKRRPQAT